MDHDLEFDRPRGFNVMSRETFEYRERMRRKLVRDGVQLDPPDLASANAWLQRRTSSGAAKASLEHYRRIVEDVLLYYGEEVPLQWSRPWGTKKSLAKARSEGKIQTRTRFLRNGVADLNLAMKAKPWKNAHIVAMFQHALLFCLLAGPRGAEPARLRVADVRPERNTIENFFQQKKSTSRNVVIPERWFWRGPAHDVEHYLTHVRPKLVAQMQDPGTYFVSSEGTAYRDHSWRMFMQRGLHHALGYPIGGHSLRRLCATLRYIYGWDIASVAEHLDDTEQVVRESYLDEGYIARVGRRAVASTEKPPLPMPFQMVKQLHTEPQR